MDLFNFHDLAICRLGYSVTKKERVRKTFNVQTAFNEPRRSCSPDLLHRIQTFDRTRHTNCLLTLADEHHKIKDIQMSCIPRNNRASFIASIPYLGHSHKCQQNETLSLHYTLCTFPESTSLLSSKGSQKHQISNAV